MTMGLWCFHNVSHRLSSKFRVVLIKCIAPIVSTVNALPTNTSDAGSPNTIAPSHTNPSNSDRNSAFQVLADGIFATDSVERYAIDYNKGYLSATSATLSLLGLLGYVRGLIKLGLGSEGCQNAGFDTRALRPLFGVPDYDRLPSDVLHEVHYVERVRSEKFMTWNLTATRKHTVDTMPVLDLATPFYRQTPNAVTICGCRLTETSEEFLHKHAYYRIPMIMAVCIGLTCFIIVPFRGGLAHQSWTMFYATFGLSFSILTGALVWVWVYAQEQLPKGHPDWVIRRLDTKHNFYASLEKRDYFAFTGSGYAFVTIDLKAVTGRLRGLICACSIVCALSAIVGYVCQYVEVRRISAAQAAKWLTVQGLFAIIRVAIWMWNPSFDDFVMERSQPGAPGHHVNLSEDQLVILWYTHVYPTRVQTKREGLRINRSQKKSEMGDYEQLRQRKSRPPNWYGLPVPSSFQIPIWALPALDFCREHTAKAFQLAQRLRAGGPTWEKDRDDFLGAEYYWDMPGWVFMLWVDAHAKQNLLLHLRQQSTTTTTTTTTGSEWKAYSCRVIRTRGNEYHFLPYWTTCNIYRFIPGYDVDMGKWTLYVENEHIPLIVFGDPAVDDRFLAGFSQGWAKGAEEKRKQGILVGWEALQGEIVFGENLERRRVEIIKWTNEMWGDLDGVLLRAWKREP